MAKTGPSTTTKVQRQIVLPLSKAVEIAWKSIRMRLSRSLLVTSGIVLALAFLMSIWTNEALIGGMRAWIADAPGSSQFQELARQQRSLEINAGELADQLRSGAVKGQTAPADQTKFDPVAALGADLGQIQKELGELPAPEDSLVTALTVKPELVDVLRNWIAARRQLAKVRDELAGPQALEILMKTHGVPTTAQEIAGSRTQTRWLLGLALLVALVGILNAMLMSVTERFREIGTMKCLGALDSFIVKLFLIESLFQGTVGTVLGAAMGLGLSLAAAYSTYQSYVWRNIPWGQIGTSALLCLGVGIALTVAGAVYPAWQAARMQPIEAMRVET